MIIVFQFVQQLNYIDYARAPNCIVVMYFMNNEKRNIYSWIPDTLANSGCTHCPKMNSEKLSKFHFHFSGLLKPGQNKKDQKIFQLHCFLNTFLQLAAEKKYSKNGAAVNFFGPSYFVTTLEIIL